MEEIKWANVVVLGLVIFALVTVIRMHEQVSGFLASMDQMGPEHTTDEKLWGLMAFGLVALILAGILKMLIQNRNDK